MLCITSLKESSRQLSLESFDVFVFIYRSATVGSWQTRYRYKESLKKLQKAAAEHTGSVAPTLSAQLAPLVEQPWLTVLSSYSSKAQAQQAAPALPPCPFCPGVADSEQEMCELSGQRYLTQRERKEVLRGWAWRGMGCFCAVVHGGLVNVTLS